MYELELLRNLSSVSLASRAQGIIATMKSKHSPGAYCGGTLTWFSEHLIGQALMVLPFPQEQTEAERPVFPSDALPGQNFTWHTSPHCCSDLEA